MHSIRASTVERWNVSQGRLWFRMLPDFGLEVGDVVEHNGVPLEVERFGPVQKLEGRTGEYVVVEARQLKADEVGAERPYVLNIDGADIIVLSYERQIGHDDAIGIKQGVEEFTGHRVLILDGGCEISGVLRPPETREAV